MDGQDAQAEATGLGNEAPSTWPKAPEPGIKPIDILKPGSTEHATVLQYLMDRLDLSERKISDLYPRWRTNEMKLQAYIHLSDYEKQLKDLNNKKAKPAQAVSIVVPYSFATQQTFVTYLLHTFCGRKPMFQIGSFKSEQIKNSKNIETMLQYQVERTRMLKWLYQHFQDGMTYGLGVMRTRWSREMQLRTTRSKQPANTFLGAAVPSVTRREPKLIYSGNMVEAQDPFMFFPDPRVPMTEVNKRGEFVFWRCFEGKHMLKRAENAGTFKYVDAANKQIPQSKWTMGNDYSGRAMVSEGEATPGMSERDSRVSNYYQVDQGTVQIIPKELGLGEEAWPITYLFTVLNKSQIVQAEPLEADHNMHPVSVAEPYSLGYGFGHPGLLDYMGPIQDTMSWLVNSHIYNVRAALNNMFIADPSRIEMQDLRNPAPGKIIRLKRAAWGMDVREALQQLNVADVTGGHLKDIEAFIRLAQYLSGATDNVMGLQEAGGRKTATEVRTAAEAGASRLAALARLYSSQSLVDLTEQMVINTQQYLDEEFAFRILGQDAADTVVKMGPDDVAGDFYFPVADGTLPLDRVALLDVWKEIFMTVAQNQQLSQTFNIVKIFEYAAELGGARNIEDFRVQPMADGTVQQQAQAGNLVSASDLAKATGAPASLTPGRSNAMMQT